MATPTFVVERNLGHAFGFDWDSASAATLTVGTGAPVDLDVRVDGTWDTHDLVVAPGDEVVVSGGGHTANLTISSVEVTFLDARSGHIEGLGPIGATVNVGPDGETPVTVVDDGGGNGVWTADFAIDTGMTGYAGIDDGEGDTTRWFWQASQVSVDAVSDEIFLNGWPEHWNVSVDIDTDGDAIFEYSDQVMPDGFGNAYLDLHGVVDIEPDDEVWAHEVVSSKYHVPTHLAVDTQLPDSTVISGSAALGSEVCIDVFGVGEECVTADAATGIWSHDHAGQGAGAVAQYDADGDATQVQLGGPAWFLVDPVLDYVWGHSFAANGTVDVSINGGYVDTLETDRSGYFATQLDPAVHDLQVGTTVAIFDDIITKDHTVTDMTVTSADDVRDQVHGTGTSGTEVWIGAHKDDPDNPAARTVTIIDGTWTADFTVPGDGGATIDILKDDTGFVHQFDADGDATASDWYVSGPENAVLAYQTNVTGNVEVFVMEADGGNAFNLTQVGAADRGPDWSPDGSRIAFHSTRTGNSEIWVMNSDGGDPVRITADEVFNELPDWSPNGSRLLYNNQGNVYVIDSDGANKTQLTTSGTDWDAVWSPDGTRVAFTSTRAAGNMDIYVMDADGTNQTRLTTEAGNDLYAAWSPDGSRLAFASHRDGTREIWVMDADGTNAIQLTSDDGWNQMPAWSPDGSRIAYSSAIDGNQEIWVMDADGTNGTQLTFTDAGVDNQAPDWRNPPLPPQSQWFSVDAPYQVWGHGEDWPEGASVQLVVDDDGVFDLAVPETYFYEASAVVERWGSESWEVGFNFNLDEVPEGETPFGIVPGHVVTIVSDFDGDGFLDVHKDLVVVGLSVDSVDPVTGVISGQGPAEAWINVQGGNEFENADRDVQADGIGYWEANLAVGEPEEGVLGLPLQPNTGGAAQIWDEDGDTNHAGWCVDCDDGGGPGGPEVFADEMEGPNGLAFDDAGSLFITDEVGGHVWKVEPDGTMTVFATGFDGPSGIAFDAAGTMYVSDDTNRVFEMDDGGVGSVFIGSAAGLSNPNRIAFDGDGNLYVVNAGDGSVAKFNPSGGPISQPLADGFATPQGIVVDDAAGVIWVADSSGQIYEVDMITGAIGEVIDTGEGNDGGLARDGEGSFYIPAVGAGEILRVDAGDWSVSSCFGGVNYPIGLAFDAEGWIYVADYEAGQVLRTGGCDGGGGPGGLGFDPGDYLISQTDGTLLVYNQNSGELWPYGLPFGGNYDIQYWDSGTLLIAVHDEGFVAAFDIGSGDTWEFFRDPAVDHPIGLALHPHEPIVYVSDEDDGVFAFNFDTGALQQLTAIGAHTIARSPDDGWIYFTNEGAPLMRVHPDGEVFGLETVVDPAGDLEMPDYQFLGFVFRDDGMIVMLSAEGPHAVLEIDPVTGAVNPLYEAGLGEDLGHLSDLAVAEDGSIVFVSNGKSGLFELGTDGTLHELHRGDPLGDAVDILIAREMGPGGPFVQVYSTSTVPPVTDVVIGQGFGPDATLTIERDGGVVEIEWPEPTDEDGGVLWVLYEVFDIQPGDIVTVSDAENTIVHTVTPLEVTSIELDTETFSSFFVSGVARPDWDIQFNMVVDPVGEGGQVLDITIHTEADGSWSIDLMDHVTFGLGGFAGSHGNIYDSDPDNPAQTTLDWWVEPDVVAIVNPNGVDDFDNALIGHGWILGEHVDVAVESPDGELLWEGTVETSYDCGDPCLEQGRWNLGDLEFELEPGMTVTASQLLEWWQEPLGWTKTMTVSALEVCPPQAATDTVCGIADAGAEILVAQGAEGDTPADQVAYRSATADQDDGRWDVSFAGEWDFEYGATGLAGTASGDGWTWVAWEAREPMMQVYPDSAAPGHTDIVTVEGFAGSVTLTITRDGTPLPPYAPYFDGEWDGCARLATFVPDFDIQVGDVVSVSDGTTTVASTLTALAITNVDVETGTFTGTARPDHQVDFELMAWREGDLDGILFDESVPTDELGNWELTLPEEVGLTNGSWWAVKDADPDRNVATVVEEWIDPFVSVVMNSREIPDLPGIDGAPATVVHGEGWVLAGEPWPFAEVTVTVHDVAGIEIYSGTAAPLSTENVDDDQSISEFFLYDVPIEPGYTVTATQDWFLADVLLPAPMSFTAATVVSDLTVIDVNLATDTVVGTAPAGADVLIFRSDDPEDEEPGGWLDTSTGEWTAHFGAEEPFGGWDIQPGDTGFVVDVSDPFGQTWLVWQALPSFAQLAELRDDVSGLLPSGNTNADREISRALAGLDEALDPAYWRDEMTLEDGKKAFAGLKTAIGSLIKDNVTSVLDTAPIIDLIMGDAAEIAQLEINRALSVAGDPQDIGKALAKMDNAEVLLAAGELIGAITAYQKAWELARKAFENKLTIGDRINVFEGGPTLHYSDDSFYIAHGWGGEEHEQYEPFGFRLFVDGVEDVADVVVRGDEVPFPNGLVPGTLSVHNFEDGLPPDTYSFVGQWTAPCWWALDNGDVVTCTDLDAPVVLEERVLEVSFGTLLVAIVEGGATEWDDQATAAATEAAADHQVGWRPFAPEGDSYEATVAMALDHGAELVIGVDFRAGEALLDAAYANPDRWFAVIDWLTDSAPANFRTIDYAREEIGFLAGYLAAGMTQTNVIGTYGGWEISTVTGFMDGFVWGADHYNLTNDAEVVVVGWDPVIRDGWFTWEFDDPAIGWDAAQGLTDMGADIIFPVAGYTGYGSAALVSERIDGGEALAMIGIDTDQFFTWGEFGNAFLSSAVINPFPSVYGAIADVALGGAFGPTYRGGLGDQSVYLAPFHDFEESVSGLAAELDALEAAIIAGDVPVP